MTNGPLRRAVLFRYRIGRKSLWLRAAALPDAVIQRHSEMTLGTCAGLVFAKRGRPGKSIVRPSKR